MKRDKSRQTAGFTLIEVLIAITLAGLVLAVLGPIFVQTTYTQQQLSGRITANVLGVGKMAELERGIEPSLVGEFLPPYQKYSWFAMEETLKDSKNMKEITLTVQWRDKNATVHQAFFKGYQASK